jgi:DNA-binding response OmpR family regulator
MQNSSRTVVLVVEDDVAIRRGLVDSLTYAGYRPVECGNGTAAMEAALDPAVELVLLDIMLPGHDGFAVLESLRAARPTLPVIMVSARGAEEDRVRGLLDGADDYVVKPFSARELLARVAAVLRRAPECQWGIRALRYGDCRIDLEERRVAWTDRPAVSLTEREVAILRYLAVNKGRIVDRKNLLHRVWGINPSGIETRTVDMHIARLREKLEYDPAQPQIILTVRGKRYKLAAAVETEQS